MNNTNALSKSSMRIARNVAKSLDKLGIKLAKRLARMSENELLCVMQVFANSDDVEAFDTIVRHRSNG